MDHLLLRRNIVSPDASMTGNHLLMVVTTLETKLCLCTAFRIAILKSQARKPGFFVIRFYLFAASSAALIMADFSLSKAAT